MRNEYELRFYARKEELLQILLDLQAARPEWKLLAGDDDNRAAKQYVVERIESAEQLAPFLWFAWVDRDSDIPDGSIQGFGTMYWPTLRTPAFRWKPESPPRTYFQATLSARSTGPKKPMEPELRTNYQMVRKFIRGYARHRTYIVRNQFREGHEISVRQYKAWCTDSVYADYKAVNGVMPKERLAGDYGPWWNDCITPVIPDWWDGDIQGTRRRAGRPGKA